VTLIRITDLSFGYPKSDGLVLRDISLTVERGEFLGIMGPTGAGKSTLCLALNGIVPQFFGGDFYGSVEVAGLDTVAHPTFELARSVAMVFEDPEMQLTAPTVEREVAFALENLCVPPDAIRTRTSQALESVGLSGMEKKHPDQLSGGQKQRLAIASALAMRPQVIVLDEPTSQLDPVGSEEVFAILRTMNRTQDLTIVLVSHASEEMAEFADRVLLLNAGRVERSGPPRLFFQDVDALLEWGIRPPAVTEAHRYAFPDRNERPITLEEAKPSLAQALHGRRLQSPPAEAPRREKGKPLIRVRDLAFAYPDGTQALRGVHLDVARGECLALVGHNGAGKSTLIKNLVGLLKPSGGTVEVLGRPVTDYQISELARHIGYVGQNPDNQIFTDSVEKEVAFALKKQRLPHDEIQDRVATALERMHLVDVVDRYPLTLSKGDRSRVVIAAVLAMDPEILIFDEPTTGQDYRGARAILDLIRELHQNGTTIIVITHHLFLLPGYVERLVILGEGKVLHDGPIRDALYADDLLERTHLRTPQLVRLAKDVGNGAFRPLLPQELAPGFHDEARIAR